MNKPFFLDGPDNATLKDPGADNAPSNGFTYSIEEGESTTEITCGAYCQPKCDIKWQKDGQDVLDVSESLVINNVSRDRAGTYTCTVTNPTTSSMANISISLDVMCEYNVYCNKNKQLS